MTIRNNFAIIAATVLLASFTPAMAEEETPINPLTQIMIDTWEATPQGVLRLMAGANMSEVTSWTDKDGLNAGITAMRWGGCEAIFNTTNEDPLCNYRDGMGEEFYESLWNYVTNGNFITTVDQDLLAQVVVTQTGAGRVKIHLKPLVPLITQVYDPRMALDYQRWRENWCNFLFVPGSHYGKSEHREGKPNREECLEDPFAVYLTETYCNGDVATCELGHLSWGYGFLTRRYMWGGEKTVIAWQQAMTTIGLEVGLELPDPAWAGTVQKLSDE